ncbi:MAG: hypothetical protein Kow0098_12100 [Ignavibacteriaceae bacterium]
MRKILLIPLLFLFATGCSVWEDFTTYFNLYYNAKDLFTRAEESIYAQKRPLFTTQNLIVPGSANTQLTQVIDKCSSILQFNSESDYVDEALLMLGKCFYYQKNYLKALRKFQELLATQPESDLVLETQLWTAKTQMRLKQYDEALELLNYVRNKSIEQDEQEFLKQSFVEEIVYKISLEQYPDAINLANEFLNLSDDDQVNAEVVFELGNLYMKTDDLESAISAFQKVFDYSPDFDLEEKANIELAKTLRKKGENVKALEIFEDIRNEDKFSNSFDIIDFESAMTYYDLGELDKALEKFQYTDTAYVNSIMSGAAQFELGQIMEKDFKDLDSAYYYYEKASRSQLPEEYLEKARDKKAIFDKYFSLQKTLDDYNQQLFYARNPEEFTKDSIAYVEDSLRAVEEYKLKVLFETNTQAFLNTSDITGDSAAVYDSTLFIPDSTYLDSLMNLVRIGLLDTTDVDSILTADSLKIVEELKKKEDDYLTESEIRIPADSLVINVKKPFKPVLSADSLESLIVKNKLNLGNLYLAELNLPDSAFKQYNEILNQFSDSTYLGTTLYALGTYYLTEGDQNKADSLFNYIYDNFRNESIVNAAADKINKPLIDLNYDPAEEIYRKAESELLNNNLNESIEIFREVYLKYPQSDFAPKALFAQGYIYENQLNLPDSAASVYDTLISHYPTSVYSINVRPKLNFYKQELLKREKALQDSLQKQQTISDSVKTLNESPVVNDNPTGVEGKEEFNNELSAISEKTDSSMIHREESVTDSILQQKPKQ